MATMGIRVKLILSAKKTDIKFLLSGHCDPSSEGEPLINLVKKRQAQSKAKSPEKKETQARKLEEKHWTGRDSSGMKIVNMYEVKRTLL